MNTKFAVALVLVAASNAVKMQKRNKECPAGFYWYDKHTGCTDCSVGHYCPTGTKKNPESCPAGTFQDMIGASTAADCKLCPIGFYADHDGAFECYECPAGFYCDFEGQAEPIMCPVNYYCEAGSITPTACPADSHNDIAGADDAGDCFVSAPTICPAGTYNLADNCVDCPAGSLCPDMGMMDEPTEVCPLDHYCPAGSVEPTQCPEEFVTDFVGAGDLTDCYRETVCGQGMLEIDFECFMCPAGFYCEEEDTEEPVWCPAGYYCPTGSTSPTECPGETTNNMVGASSANDCEGEGDSANVEFADEDGTDDEEECTGRHCDDTDDEADGTDDEADGTDDEADGTDDEADGTDDEADGTDDEADGTDDEADGTDDEADGTDDEADETDKSRDEETDKSRDEEVVEEAM